VVGHEENILQDVVHSIEKFLREEKKVSFKQLKRMWIDRENLEVRYIIKKLKENNFLQHFYSHRHRPK